jgi:hypothetical protein
MAKKTNKQQTSKADNFKGATGNTFSKENQPTPEAKSAGKRRKRELKELAEALITGDAKEKAQATALRLGIDLTDEEFTLEIIMTLRQIEKAIAEGDTRAYSAAMDRLKGKPLMSSDVKLTTEAEPRQYDYSILDPEEISALLKIHIKMGDPVPTDSATLSRLSKKDRKEIIGERIKAINRSKE